MSKLYFGVFLAIFFGAPNMRKWINIGFGYLRVLHKSELKSEYPKLDSFGSLPRFSAGCRFSAHFWGFRTAGCPSHPSWEWFGRMAGDGPANVQFPRKNLGQLSAPLSRSIKRSPRRWWLDHLLFFIYLIYYHIYNYIYILKWISHYRCYLVYPCLSYHYRF